MEDFDIKQVALKYVGWPYENQARGENNKLDCFGLLILIYRDLGRYVPDSKEDYSTDWSKSGKDLFREGIEFFAYLWEPVVNPEPGDIVMFKNVNGVATHVGVMIDKIKFIHACSKTGVVTTSLAGKYKDKLYGYYRWKE